MLNKVAPIRMRFSRINKLGRFFLFIISHKYGFIIHTWARDSHYKMLNTQNRNEKSLQSPQIIKIFQ